jgi:SAM-dependent methyltransferase
MNKPDPSEIKQYWEEKAEALKADPSATMKDIILRSMEIEAISARLGIDDILLDVGCGNAFGSIEFARHCQRVTAMDYSENMIEVAKASIRQSHLTNIRAVQGNILTVGRENPSAFSALSSVRCLINIPGKKDQYNGIEQISYALKPGGKLFLVEGIEENFNALNFMRQKMELRPIKLDWHNLLFKKQELETALEKFLYIKEIIDFGEYYYLSRIIHPLLVQPEEPVFSGKMNHIGKKIWQSMISKGCFSNISTLLLYFCIKK